MIGYNLIVELGIAMTIEKLNRLAQLGWLSVNKIIATDEQGEYENLIKEWKQEQENKFDIRRLKVGDRILNRHIKGTFVIVAIDKHPIAAFICPVTNPTEWTKPDA